ncbi:prominin-like protein [Chrysoperla carnea]|uniref:prominin-like protein n=1 Tax=Chrysoperla carnea TaxID=189513 RepID=UPI001D065655|nr:prominin-like protein [Chrysoperla carnea]
MKTKVFVFACTIFVLTVSTWIGAGASFTTRVKGISEDLENALGRVLNVDNVSFTPLPMNRTYNSTTAYYPRGMTGVYNVTKIVIQFIMAKEPLPPGFLIYDDKAGMIKPAGDLMSEWLTLLKHYGGILAICCVAIIFIAIMPFAALFFCCCRCCGRCGARSQPFDKKHDMCKKVLLSMLLICITTLMLFGVVSAFVTNTYMQNGTDELPNSVRTSIKDTRGYISFTQLQLETLLDTNFQELEQNLIDILDTSGAIVSEKLKEYSNAVALSQLAGIVHDLPDVSRDLRKMKTETTDLRTNASRLNDGLRHVKAELLRELTDCQTAGVRECKEFKGLNDIGKLDTTVDFSNYLDRYFPRLPDVSESLKNITELLDSNIVEEVQKGKKAFDDIQKQIQKAVDDSIPVVKEAIAGAGDAIKSNAKNLTNMLTQASDAIGQHSKKPIDQADLYLAQYSIYRWYGGLAISTLLLIVALCASCGLLCGICGKRPDGYGDDCCNKGSGSKFLMLGVAIIFLFSSALMAVCIATMLIGIVTEKGVCEPMKQPTAPSSTELWSLIDQFIGLDKATGLNLELSQVIDSCHRNKSVYKVLALEQKFNLKELESKDKITMDHGITILTKEAKGKLQKLADSGIGDIKFDRFTEILRDNITSISLTDLSHKLTDTANKIGDKQDLQQIKLSLQRNALYLETFQNTLVVPMVQSAEDLKETAVRLEEGLKFNHSSFNEAVNYLLKEVEEAQEYLQTNGTKDVAEIAEEFATNLEGRIKHYLRHVAYELEHNVGQCGPISNAYNATVVAACSKIVQPLNAFWVSLGWCILLFIPTLVLSVKLATLYQKSDPYPGPLVEAEYMYDAYADRDNIPLANAHRKKTKKCGRGPAYHQETYENPGGYASDSAANVRSAGDAPSSSRDMRYTDMAPKHWEDFPNGGPPQYHSPPTEYERPPPYYYPGPGTHP